MNDSELKKRHPNWFDSKGKYIPQTQETEITKGLTQKKAKSEALRRKAQKGTKHLKVHPIHYGEEKEE